MKRIPRFIISELVLNEALRYLGSPTASSSNSCNPISSASKSAKELASDNKYCDSNLVSLDKEQSRHLREVLRLSIGEEIELVCLTPPCSYLGEIAGFKKNQAEVKIIKQLKATENFHQNTHPRIELIQAYPQPKVAESLAEKLTELGISTLKFFTSQRKSVKGGISGNKLERLEKKAVTAIKQSGNLHKLELHFYETLSEALTDSPGNQSQDVPPISLNNSGILKVIFLAPTFDEYSGSLNCDENSKRPLTLIQILSKLLLRPERIQLLIGPEEGLSKEEIQVALDSGFVPSSLGAHTLKVETAAVLAGGICNIFFE